MTTLRSRLTQEYHNVELTLSNHAGGKDESNLKELTIAADEARIKKDMHQVMKSSRSTRHKYKENTAGHNVNGYVTDLLGVSFTKSFNGKNENDKKSVTFCRRLSIRKIKPLSAMPQCVIEDYWFSSDDYELMKREYEYLLFFMDVGENENIDGESDSTRGLECKTEEGAWQRFQQRRCLFDAVFNEQDRQAKEGIDDPLIIAQICQELSKSSVDAALGLAKQDETTSKEYTDRKSRLSDAVKCGSDNDIPGEAIKELAESTVGGFSVGKVNTDDDESAGGGGGNQHLVRRWSTACDSRQFYNYNNFVVDGSTDNNVKRWSLPPKRKREVNTNHDLVLGGGCNEYTGRRWTALPRGQRKNLFDMWNIEDILANKNGKE